MGDLPPITTPTADATTMGDAAASLDGITAPNGTGVTGEIDPSIAINVLPKLQTRVVREARRETWFVVNETGDELATVPIVLGEGRSIRRVQVNGEVAEFSASPGLVLVRPRRPLRAGAGTIVVIHLR